MFGESESESPRLPSPWDSLISVPPSPLSAPDQRNIPQLAPESEEGNVEYKLQLLCPSPARFARLVTQMKWRLLEGGGQAYYELGVADDGALIGLPRAELEQSLETLDRMAGEIGASVIVVKEIEVPAVMAGFETDRWNRKRFYRRQSDAINTNSSISATECEDEQFNTNTTCTNPVLDSTSACSSASSELPSSHLRNSSYTPLNSDHFVPPFPRTESKVDPLNNSITEKASVVSLPAINHELMHKPLPVSQFGRSRIIQTKEDTTIVYRLKLCDRKRDRKRNALSARPVSKPHKNAVQLKAVANDTIFCSTASPLRGEISSLSVSETTADRAFGSSFTQMADPLPFIDTKLIPVLHLESDTETDGTDVRLRVMNPAIAVSPSTLSAQHSSGIESSDLRLIVEALVVRKMSLDEAFLDFSGFSLS